MFDAEDLLSAPELDRIGQSHPLPGDHASACPQLWRAAAIAADVGDRRYEAHLLRLAAVKHAELGRRDRHRPTSAVRSTQPSFRPPVTSSPPTAGPGLLRMAQTASKSMAQFVGSGFKMPQP